MNPKKLKPKASKFKYASWQVQSCTTQKAISATKSAHLAHNKAQKVTVKTCKLIQTHEHTKFIDIMFSYGNETQNICIIILLLAK